MADLLLAQPYPHAEKPQQNPRNVIFLFKLLYILFGIPICDDSNTDVGGRGQILKPLAMYRGGQGKAPACCMTGQ